MKIVWAHRLVGKILDSSTIWFSFEKCLWKSLKCFGADVHSRGNLQTRINIFRGGEIFLSGLRISLLVACEIMHAWLIYSNSRKPWWMFMTPRFLRCASHLQQSVTEVMIPGSRQNCATRRSSAATTARPPASLWERVSAKVSPWKGLWTLVQFGLTTLAGTVCQRIALLEH